MRLYVALLVQNSSKRQHGMKVNGKTLALGVEFIAKIERCVATAAERPMSYLAIYKDIRRVVAKRFPFSVYFRTEATVTLVPIGTLPSRWAPRREDPGALTGVLPAPPSCRRMR
jgi:hypothetical protein